MISYLLGGDPQVVEARTGEQIEIRESCNANVLPETVFELLRPANNLSISKASDDLVVFEVECLCSHTNADDERRYRSEEEIQAVAQEADPIKKLAAHVNKSGVSAQELKASESERREAVDRTAENTLIIWTAKPALDAKKPLPSALTSLGEPPLGSTKS